MPRYVRGEARDGLAPSLASVFGGCVTLGWSPPRPLASLSPRQLHGVEVAEVRTGAHFRGLVWLPCPRILEI